MAVLLHSDRPDDLRLAEPVPLTLHPAGVYLSSLSGGSRRTIRYCLNTIAGMLTDQCCDALTLDWSKLRYHHTAAVRDYLRHNFAPVTANKMLSALRRVLREAHRLDLMAAEDYQKAVDLPNLPAHASQPRGRCLSGGEIAALMGTCSSDCPLDVRDAAIVAVLRGTGMRRAELVRLELRDFKRGRGELLVRLSKGDKSRLVYLPQESESHLERWLSLRGDEPGPLFCRIRRGGHLHLEFLHPDSVWRLLQRRANQAGVESFSPHDFRRTFCSDLLDAGVDIVTVQKLAGHASPVTTARYDRRGEEVKRRAVRRLGFGEGCPRDLDDKC